MFMRPQLVARLADMRSYLDIPRFRLRTQLKEAGAFRGQLSAAARTARACGPKSDENGDEL